MSSLSHDMFEELKQNMDHAERFANSLNCRRLSQKTFVEVEAINEIRFVIDETDVTVVVDYSYTDSYHDEYVHDDTVVFVMNDDFEFAKN